MLAYIAHRAGVEGRKVVEIGAGRGELTRYIAPRANRVLAVEVDRSLTRYHQAVPGNVEWVYMDALEVDWQKLLRNGPWIVIGNLPFHITSPLLFKLFPHLETVEGIYFLVQKEVAQRLSSPPGSSSFGLMSVIAQLQCEVAQLKSVSRKNFSPPPKVDAALIQLIPKRAFAYDEEFLRFVKRGFTHRRKKLRRFLEQENLVHESLVPFKDKRPQELSPQEWWKLYSATKKSM